MSSYSDYAQALTAIENRRGQAQADAARQKGAIWGNTIANIGQMIGNIPQQQAELKKVEAMAKETELRQQHEARMAAQEQQQADHAQALQGILQKHGGDFEAALPEIAALDPMLGMDIGKRLNEANKAAFDFKSSQHQAKVKELDAMHNLVGSATDEASYAQALYTAKLMGMDVSQVPPTYDPNVVAQFNRALLTAKERLAQDEPKERPLVQVPTSQGGVSGVVFKKPVEGEFVPSAQKDEHSAIYKEWQDYKSTGGTLDFDAYMTQDANRKRPVTHVTASGGAADESGLDAGGREVAATVYRLTRQLPSRNAKQTGPILNEVARQNKMLGNSPAAMVQKQAIFAGDQKALNKLQGMQAAADVFETKANAQTDIIRTLSAQVPRTAFPIINSALQTGRTEITGDTKATQLANAIETFSEEYTKIMSGTTGGSAAATDSTRGAAKRLINAAMSKGTMTDVLALMQQEMNLTMMGYEVGIDHITKGMTGASAPATAAPAGPTPTLRYNPATGKTEPIGAR